MPDFQLSVLIPVYNGEKTIFSLVEKIFEDLENTSFEIILVNDGSNDNSEKICESLTQTFKNITFLSLRKNFGEFNAVICGLNYAKGEFVTIIDDDFQNPPTEILKLLNLCQNNNFDVVYSFYDEKKHTWFRNFGSYFVNLIATKLINKPKNLYLSSFKLIKKDVVNEIIKYKGPYPYIDALIFRTTNNVGKVQVKHENRKEGKSNYSLKKLFNLFMTIVFGYSILPSRVILTTGFSLIIISFFLLLFYFFFGTGNWIISTFIFFGGIQLTSIGIIGEYISKSFLSQNAHPQYVIKKKIESN